MFLVICSATIIHTGTLLILMAIFEAKTFYVNDHYSDYIIPQFVGIDFSIVKPNVFYVMTYDMS